jgi:transcriptional regulator with XRE-family HTH domain
MTITADQVKAARTLLRWSIVKTAVQTSVGKDPIERFERGQRELRPETLAHLQSAFEAAGVEFTKSSARLKKPPE